MSKDILVDNSVAKNFCNPLDPHYKAFVLWLFHEGVLVVTQRLVNEYHGASGNSESPTNIVAVVNRLLIDGRIHLCHKKRLAAFRFPSRVARRLQSNRKDHDSVKAVMLSVRKFALTLDKNLQDDINGYPGFSARAERRPEEIPYATT